MYFVNEPETLNQKQKVKEKMKTKRSNESIAFPCAQNYSAKLDQLASS